MIGSLPHPRPLSQEGRGECGGFRQALRQAQHTAQPSGFRQAQPSGFRYARWRSLHFDKLNASSTRLGVGGSSRASARTETRRRTRLSPHPQPPSHQGRGESRHPPHPRWTNLLSPMVVQDFRVSDFCRRGCRRSAHPCAGEKALEATPLRHTSQPFKTLSEKGQRKKLNERIRNQIYSKSVYKNTT
jgi:hypothetical protein